jgi:hypothetical protein
MMSEYAVKKILVKQQTAPAHPNFFTEEDK